MKPTASLFVHNGVARLSGHHLLAGVTYRFDLIRYAGAAPHNFDDRAVIADAAGDGEASWAIDGPVAHYVGIVYYTNTQLATDTAVGA